MSLNRDNPQMSAEDLRRIIAEAKPGQRLLVTFSSSGSDRHLSDRIQAILGISDPIGKALFFTPTDLSYLQRVYRNSRWEGNRTFKVLLLDGFNPEIFIRLTVGRNFLVSVRRDS